MSSPFYMERPPVNTTWKDVFIPINDLGFNIINNIAAFGIFHGFPGYLDIHIAEISFTNAVVEVIPLSPNEEICYSDNHCEMTQQNNVIIPVVTTTTTNTGGQSTTDSTCSGNTGNTGNTGKDENMESSSIILNISSLLILIISFTLFTIVA